PGPRPPRRHPPHTCARGPAPRARLPAGSQAPLAGAMDVGIMIVGGPLRILFATIHAAIKDVPALLTPERIAQAIRLCHRGLTELFGIKRPRIAVAALNPHAGEGGLFGTEERTAIGPGIERA